MAVTKTYAFSSVDFLDPAFITAASDATSLSNGGFVVLGDHSGTHIDGSIYGSAASAVNGFTSLLGTGG